MSEGTGVPDRDAELYDEHWQPVLAPAVPRFLDRVDALLGPPAAVPGSRPLVIDLGTGTAALLVAAAARWPEAGFVGLDPSPAMLERGRSRVAGAGPVAEAAAVRWIVGSAESIPLEDDGAERVISSFALQLVSDRAAAFGEVRRILRPGSCLAFVTWLGPDTLLPADEEFDEAVLDLALEDPDPAEEDGPDEPAGQRGDFESLAATERELRGAGFADRRLFEDLLTHSWTPESYLAFKLSYDERSLVETLDEGSREALVARVRERWRRLPSGAFTLRAPLVVALARRA